MIPRFLCHTCRHRFTAAEGFRSRRAAPERIALAVDLYFRGLSLRKIVEHLDQVYNLRVSPSTVYAWVARSSVFAALQAWFTTNTSSGTAPLAVSFGASTQAGEGPFSYAWTFGDGGTSNVATPSHVYTAAGNWTVTLLVTDGLGYTATSTEVVSVQPVPQSTAPPHSTTPPQGSGPASNGGSPAMASPDVVYVGLALAILAIGVAVAVVISRRHEPPPR